jgi:hypothetical protein
LPKIFEWNGYKFFFFANEGNPRESCHVHVRKGEQLAKFWIDPIVRLEWSSELSKIERVVTDNSALIRSKWNEFFGI